MLRRVEPARRSTSRDSTGLPAEPKEDNRHPSAPRCGRPTQASARRRRARRRFRPAEGTARRFGALPRGPSRRPAPDPLRRRWSQETGTDGTHPSGASALPAPRSPSGPPGHGVLHREVTDLRPRPERRFPATEGSHPTDGQPRLRPGATRSGNAERASAHSTRSLQAIEYQHDASAPAPDPLRRRRSQPSGKPATAGALRSPDPTRRPNGSAGAPAPDPLRRRRSQEHWSCEPSPTSSEVVDQPARPSRPSPLRKWSEARREPRPASSEAGRSLHRALSRARPPTPASSEAEQSEHPGPSKAALFGRQPGRRPGHRPNLLGGQAAAGTLTPSHRRPTPGWTRRATTPQPDAARPRADRRQQRDPQPDAARPRADRRQQRTLPPDAARPRADRRQQQHLAARRGPPSGRLKTAARATGSSEPAAPRESKPGEDQKPKEASSDHLAATPGGPQRTSWWLQALRSRGVAEARNNPVATQADGEWKPHLNGERAKAVVTRYGYQGGKSFGGSAPSGTAPCPPRPPRGPVEQGT